jgi:hypothetical protein
MSRGMLAGGWLWAAAAGWWLAGCGGGDFGMRVEIPAKDRAPITEAVREGMRIVLPEQPFNVHSRQSAQTPGATGQARGESDARASGQAFCEAQASGGGSAWGEFQLGHALHNASGAAVRMTVKLDLQYTQAARAKPAEARQTLANFVLKVFLKDTRGKLLHQEVLGALSSDEGQASWSGRRQVEFEAVLAPETAYDLVVAGRASATSEEGTEAGARIEIQQLGAELLCQLAK